MKRAVVFLLAFFYITLTSGVVVNVHYCMGRIAGVTYGHESDHKCEKCGMDQRSGCCETEFKLVKADDDHLYVKSLSAPFSSEAIIPVLFKEYISGRIIEREHFNSQYHSPPDIRSNDLGVYNSVFRI